MRVTEMGSKRRLPCNRADRVCVASWGQDHLAGNGADFLLVLDSRTLEEPMQAAKASDDGVTRWCSFTHERWIFDRAQSAASQYRVGLLRFESGRVLVFAGGVFGCSSRMNGNLQVRFLGGWAPAMAPGYFDH